MSETTEEQPLDTSAIPAVWARYTDVVVDHGEGSWLIATDGGRYLDYSSGIGVTSTGHAHPRVVRAIADQAAKVIHAQQNIVFHEPGVRLHARLAKILPGGPWQAFLCNSGAEAVEAAVKLARAMTQRPVLIAFRGGFHGRTAQTMALTSSRMLVRGDFEPLPGSVHHVPFPYCYRAAAGPHSPEACICDWEAQLELLLAQMVEPSQVAAIIVEPVLGEGGYVVPPPSFLPRLRAVTRRYGMLLIADEIQTGIGRTGAMFAIEHSQVEPDIVVFAKGIASGLPLSGIIARQDLFDSWRPGAHGGTFGGNVVACAAAMATLDVIESEGLVENARARGAELLDGLRGLKTSHKHVGDVRGLGLMAAMELVNPESDDGRQPAPDLAHLVIGKALERHLIILSAGTWGQVVRVIPPLVTTAAEVDQALMILDESLSAAGA